MALTASNTTVGSVTRPPLNMGERSAREGMSPLGTAVALCVHPTTSPEVSIAVSSFSGIVSAS